MLAGELVHWRMTAFCYMQFKWMRKNNILIKKRYRKNTHQENIWLTLFSPFSFNLCANIFILISDSHCLNLHHHWSPSNFKVKISKNNVDHCLSFFFRPLQCMSFFDLRLSINPFVLSNFSLNMHTILYSRSSLLPSHTRVWSKSRWQNEGVYCYC